MGKADDVSRLDSPTAPHPALKARILLGLDLLPVVPADTADVQEQVQPSTRKMPESSMADAQRGLDEIASRSEHLPGELGDLGPDPKPATHPPRVNKAGRRARAGVDGEGRWRTYPPALHLRRGAPLAW